MLPISKHKTLIIPHRLALIAAGVCLGLSFTVDQATIDDRLQAERSPPSDQAETVGTGAVSVSPSDQSRDHAAGGNVSLLPWFSGLSR